MTGTIDVTVKYQLPNEDLDSLISVTTDEDVENMMEEYDRLTLNQNPRSDRLRLFLFPKGDDSRASSISSANRDHWFLDALNNSVGGGGSALERGRSETSSILSELPDYLFGLDNSDETQPRDPKIRSTRQVLSENVSNSVPGSPATVVASPFCSTSSAPSVQSILNLPPVKTKPDNSDPVVEHKENQVEGFVETGEPSILQPTGYPGNPMIHYISDPRYPGHTVQHVPTVYYIPGPVQPGNVPVQPVHMQAPYVHQYSTGPGQIPLGYHHLGPGVGQVYNGGMRPVTATTFDPYDVSGRVVSDGVNQQAFYGVKNQGRVPLYSGMVVSGGEDLQLVANPCDARESSSKNMNT
jgi:hypothetical protein